MSASYLDTDWSFFSPGPNIDSPEGKKLQGRTVTELFDILEQISPGVTHNLD